MTKRTFKPNLRIELHHKDPNLTKESAKAVCLPNTQQRINGGLSQDGAAWRNSGLVHSPPAPDTRPGFAR